MSQVLTILLNLSKLLSDRLSKAKYKPFRAFASSKGQKPDFISSKTFNRVFITEKIHIYCLNLFTKGSKILTGCFYIYRKRNKLNKILKYTSPLKITLLKGINTHTQRMVNSLSSKKSFSGGQNRNFFLKSLYR
jgi:hypothetical protein